MSVPPISGIPAVSPGHPAVPPGSRLGSEFEKAFEAVESGIGGVGGAAKPDAASAIGSALEAVSAAEFEADAIARNLAAGGDAEVHDLMIAMSKAQLSVDLLVQVRNRALEAYTEIMRMQI